MDPYVDVLADAAQQLGIKAPAPVDLENGVVLGTTSDGQAYALGFRSVSGAPVGFAVHAVGAGPHLGRVSVVRPAKWPAITAKNRVRTGDLRFDGMLACHGHALTVHALLGHEVRARLTTMFERHDLASVEVDEERVTIRGADLAMNAVAIVELVRDACTLSSAATRRSGDPHRRLLDHVVDDRAPRLRAVCAEALLGRVVPGSDEERTVCRSMVECETLLSRIRVDAMIRLRRHEPTLVGDVFQRSLAAAAPDVVENAARYMGEHGMKGATERLVDLLRHEHDTVCAAAAWSLGRLDAPSAEGALIAQLLEPRRGGAVVVAILDALSEVGGPNALAVLRPRERGVLRARAVKKAARRAIERIGARVGPSEPGTLSVVESTSGELSLRTDESGE